MTRAAAHADGPVPHAGRLWLFFLGPPLLWFVHLGVVYGLGSPLCERAPLAAVLAATAVAVAAVAAGGVLARRSWLETGGGWPRGHGDPLAPRRFLAFLGYGASVGFGLAILVQTLPALLVEGCR